MRCRAKALENGGMDHVETERAPSEDNQWDAKLQTYHDQLDKVQAALQQDPTNHEWRKLKQNLEHLIALTNQLKQGKEQDANQTTNFKLNDRCIAKFNVDQKFYHAKIVAVTDENYVVTFLGYGDTAQVPKNQCKPYVRPDTKYWAQGQQLRALHPSHRIWKTATLIKVTNDSAHLIFADEPGITVQVDIHLVHADRDGHLQDEGFQTPQNLEIQPGDSQEVILRKKRRLKIVKRQDKKQREDQACESQRTSWQNFAKHNKTIRKSVNTHDPKWDPTRDHGERASREQMDPFRGKQKYR